MPGFKWLVDSFGTNWRLTEAQSAIGRIQLRKLDGWVAKRRANAATIAAAVAGIPGISVGAPPQGCAHAYYRQTLFVRPDALKTEWSRDRICTELDGRGIPARVGACPDISLEQAFVKTGLTAQPAHPHAQDTAGRSIVLPVHPTLTADDIGFIADSAREILRAAVR